MVDAIISAVAEYLTSMPLSAVAEEVKLVTGANDEVNKLVTSLKSVRALLDEAEEQQLEAVPVKDWLCNLKAISYDMDDVIDKWKTWIQKSQFQNQHHSSGSNQNHLKHKVLRVFRCICVINRDVRVRHGVARKIRAIQQRLDKIATDNIRHQLSPSQKTEKYIEGRMTTPFIIDMEKVKGRNKEKDKVKSQILKAESNPHIISLVGWGGIGKTTLAQLVYNDSDIETHFDKKIWVCVSKPFDEMRIAKAILESLCGPSAHAFRELANVLNEISASLNGKIFLLVLDDVWTQNRRDWKELEKIFRFGLPGSTILITTRKKRVAEVMGCNPMSLHEVGLLTPEECWSIISQIALDQGDCQKLESIGRRIADKCKGLPLAAITIGGLLRFKKSEEEWLRVLEKKEWKDEDNLNEGEGILGPLKLSYYDLPLPLKQCFSYCAIFPEDFEIGDRRLIMMWMAQGFIKAREEEDLEMLGVAYFKNLVERSLLQSDERYICCMWEKHYRLHDMVSDLVCTIAKDECLMIRVLNHTQPNRNFLHSDGKARHLFLEIENNAPFPVSVYGFKKLRSLVIYLSRLSVVELKGIFGHLTCLRTLDLRSCGIRKVPSSINRLVHLRLLDLSKNRGLKKLPEDLCECYNLQALILIDCESLTKLPKRIGKLINLMYLKFNRVRIKYLPKGLENLQQLRELTLFFISVIKSESFSIGEMEKLNNLRGRLTITGLRNVRKQEEAKKAQLKEKKRVNELILNFGADFFSLSFDEDHVQEDEEEILEALEPPSNLEILNIEKYRGKTFPSWMTKLNLLKELKIDNFGNWEELPPLSKLPCLEHLYLRYMGVKRVSVDFLGIEKDSSTIFVSFPNLQHLDFFSFSEWEEWDDIEEWMMEKINNKIITIMPSLHRIDIMSCPKLRTLPYHLLSPSITSGLQELYISFCDVLQQESATDKLSHVSSLYGSPGYYTRRREETDVEGGSGGGGGDSEQWVVED